MKSASHSRKKWSLAALAAADLVVFSGTSPHSASSIVLFIGFMLLAASFYVLLLGALRLVAWYGVSPGRYRKRFIRLMAGLFSGLVALQSIGELSPRDVLVLLPLAFLAYLYMSYGRKVAPAAAPAVSS
ncbi:MAG TPA: hypothetical protein VFH99_01070 [Candidatus Saccharimonadales bacterium]|nr:hypothetical protein [Candidatus Saccharimonadales bacterium]